MEYAIQSEIAFKEQKYCSKCNKSFDEPKLIQYYACPNCLNKIKEKKSSGCQHWLGYLNQRTTGESIPQDCVECENVLKCLLNKYCDSSSAIHEIGKWYSSNGNDSH
jgi:DNA-directed RNA polymerase subunit RPC12/RpoP